MRWGRRCVVFSILIFPFLNWLQAQLKQEREKLEQEHEKMERQKEEEEMLLQQEDEEV